MNDRRPTTDDQQQMTQNQFFRPLFVVCCLLSATLPVAVHGYVFPRDLSLGSQGEDVRQLQIELNKNPATQVSYTGIGSPGQETTHFGPKTADAVARYQNLHAQKILTPLGLSRGTGYVGVSTRAQLSGGNQSVARAAAPTVTSISPTRGGAGTVVTVRGNGFTPTGNKVSSVFEEFENVSSSDGTTLEIVIQGPFPKDFLESNKAFYENYGFEMDYQLVVSNSNGVSGFLPFRFTFY